MKKIEEVLAGGVNKFSSVSIEIDLMIPSTVITSNSRICKAIQISYDLRVEAMLSFYKNIEIIVPITIGSFNFDDRPADDSFQISRQIDHFSNDLTTLQDRRLTKFFLMLKYINFLFCSSTFIRWSYEVDFQTFLGKEFKLKFEYFKTLFFCLLVKSIEDIHGVSIFGLKFYIRAIHDNMYINNNHYSWLWFLIKLQKSSIYFQLKYIIVLKSKTSWNI